MPCTKPYATPYHVIYDAIPVKRRIRRHIDATYEDDAISRHIRHYITPYLTPYRSDAIYNPMSHVRRRHTGKTPCTTPSSIPSHATYVAIPIIHQIRRVGAIHDAVSRHNDARPLTRHTRRHNEALYFAMTRPIRRHTDTTPNTTPCLL